MRSAITFFNIQLSNSRDDYGRSAIMSLNEFSEHYKKVLSGEIRPFELMKQLDISKSTYYRYVNKIPTMKSVDK